ncbi:MAG: hypothetical protein KJ069_28945 [Anaerolineae bacterium]|nr:hypothetical protein [Anaerolineae bacterium]
MRTYIDALIKNMAQVLNENELRPLVFALNVDWEELPGETKSSKVWALIITLGKEGRLADLIAALRMERSHVPWEDAPSPAQQMAVCKPINLAGSTAFFSFSQGVDIMEALGDEVVDYAYDLQTSGTQHRRIVEAREGMIVNRSYGLMETITPEQFAEKLMPEDLEHINTLAKAMDNHYQQWREIYPKRGSYARPSQNKKVEQRLDELVSEVGQELGRIVRYLERLEFTLDDHYQRYRDLADQFG